MGRGDPGAPSPGRGSRTEFGAAARGGGGGGEGWRWDPPTLPTPGARERWRCRFRCGLEETLHPPRLRPSHYHGSIPFPSPRSHHGSARSRSPAVPALAPRATRSSCRGGTWREAESWAEVRARRQGPRDCVPTPLGWTGQAPFSVAQMTPLEFTQMQRFKLYHG